jgi:hypothetical protein
MIDNGILEIALPVPAAIAPSARSFRLRAWEPGEGKDRIRRPGRAIVTDAWVTASRSGPWSILFAQTL